MTKKPITLTILFLAICSSVQADQILYDVTLLGDLPDGRPSGVTRADCISNNGLIAGSGYPQSAGPVAVLYDASGNGSNINLDPYGRYSWARGINVHGHVVGYGDLGGGSKKAILFDINGNGNNVVLGSVSDRYGIKAYAINDHNLIVGGSHNGRYRKAWIFDITGNRNNIYLGRGEAIAVSNNGIIVGSSYFGYSSDASPAVFDPTGKGNNISLGGKGSAHSVNDYGEVVGYVATNGTLRAKLFFASRDRSAVTIGNDDSTAESINNKGQIVGTEQGFATLFDIKGSRNNINLNNVIDPTLGWVLKDAFAINEEGWIIGRGILNGIDAKFLLTPTQKPLMVSFDVKPNNCPNKVHYKSNGLIPVAILGTDDFDVTSIDVSSIELMGVTPLLSSYEDVAGANNEQYMIEQVSDAFYIVPDNGAYIIDFDETGIITSTIEVTDLNGYQFTPDNYEIIPLGTKTRLRLLVPPFAKGEEILIDYCYLVELEYNCVAVEPDGHLDLSLKFDTQEIVTTLGEVIDSDMWMLHLTGSLYDGTEIEGTDCIEKLK